MVTDSNNKLP